MKMRRRMSKMRPMKRTANEYDSILKRSYKFVPTLYCPM